MTLPVETLPVFCQDCRTVVAHKVGDCLLTCSACGLERVAMGRLLAAALLGAWLMSLPPRFRYVPARSARALRPGHRIPGHRPVRGCRGRSGPPIPQQREGHPFMTPRTTLPLAALGVLALAVTACSSSVNTEPDEVSIVYSAAKGSATKFEKCVPVSSRAGVDATDNSWTYPAGQRNFRFTGEQGAESGPISVVSKDNITLTVPGFATFALNTECKTLQTFHEKIGLKYSAFLYGTETSATSESPDVTGWVAMLNTYLKGPLDRAMDAASQEFGWKELYNDPATKAAWEKRVGELVGDFITKSGGGQFFCQPNFAGVGECGAVVLTLQKPQPPQALVDAMASEQAAKVQNDAQKQINMRVDTELESIQKLVKLLGPDAYVKYRAVIGDKPITVVLSDGTVTVPAK